MKHIVLRDNSLYGWAYGMLRSFEDAIVKETAATIQIIPKEKGSYLGSKIKKGTRWEFLSPILKKKNFDVSGDVIWYVLMGPENYRFDRYNIKFAEKPKVKILYLFDTFPSQYRLIKKMLSDSFWDILITSFSDSIRDLEEITGRKWHYVPQAADSKLFIPTSLSEKNIAFSSYGRRIEKYHEIVKEFCSDKGLYYDYTTHDAKHPTADPNELYKQFAWHLNQSIFTICWPVEMTHPRRAEHIQAVTCRWYEAHAANSIIVGEIPKNNFFLKELPDLKYVCMPLLKTDKEIISFLDLLWQKRDSFFKDNSKPVNIYWEDRVKKILNLIKDL